MAQLSRFHAGDLAMRSVHRYGRLDDYADQCESIRLRIGQQLGAVRAKHELWLSLADQDKVAALREIRDILKKAATRAIRHGDRPFGMGPAPADCS